MEAIWSGKFFLAIWLALSGAPHLCAGFLGLIRQRPPIWSTRWSGARSLLLAPVLLDGYGIFSAPFTAADGVLLALAVGILILDDRMLWDRGSYTVYGATHVAAETALFAALDKLELKDEARSGSRTMYVAGEYIKIFSPKPYLGCYSIRTRGRGGRQLLRQIVDLMAQSIREGQVEVSKKLLALNLVYGVGLVGFGFWIYWASRITHVIR